MKRNCFDYRVAAIFTITGVELGRLVTLSRLHYDGKCQQARLLGGFLYGLCIQWAIANQNKLTNFESSPNSLDEHDRKLSKDELELTVEVIATTSELGLLAKIGEAENFYCRGGDTPASMMLTAQFIGMLKECEAEVNRIFTTVTPI